MSWIENQSHKGEWIENMSLTSFQTAKMKSLCFFLILIDFFCLGWNNSLNSNKRPGSNKDVQGGKFRKYSLASMDVY